jgi:23S rRNA (adenine2503-C2)-methyltransferase
MKILKKIGNENLAVVYVGKIKDKNIEFAESLQPPFHIREKWVLTISCLYGCPVNCLMCDAGINYYGRLSGEEIIMQIDYLIKRRFPDNIIPVKKFKIQFARMGEPAYNPAVLNVLEKLPYKYSAPGLIPSISTIGPENSTPFFNRLRHLKNKYYSNGKFQMQFSIHTTDPGKRDELIPVKKLSFAQISRYGNEFFNHGDRKITLNFVVMKNYPIDPQVIKYFFDPEIFIIKLTPLNPTQNANENNLQTKLDPYDELSVSILVDDFQKLGFDTIVSIGEPEENIIGSNCGQYISSIK